MLIFYAGVWTHYNQKMNNILAKGDTYEFLSAAHEVGVHAGQVKRQGDIVTKYLTYRIWSKRKV